jgi:hypothetical protein
MMWFAPFQVDEARSTLVLDLGNSVSTTAPYGGPFALDTLAVTLDAYGTNQPVATLSYDLSTYAATAGIYEVPLTAAQMALAASTSVGVSGTGPNGAGGATTERITGVWVAMDPSFGRADPGESIAVDVYARQWGLPLDDELDFTLTPIANSDNTGQPPLVGSEPATGLVYPGYATPSGGKATLTLTGGSTLPKPAYREGVDGQIYNLVGSWWSSALAGAGVPAITVLVFDAYAPQTTPPTWWGDIQPIMYAFARLYPGMRDIMDISDYGTLTSPIPRMGKTGAQLVAEVLTLPLSHPNHMPVTRDLSAAKTRAVVDWVAAGCPEGTAPAGFSPSGGPVTPSPAQPVDLGSVKSALVAPRG